MQLFSRNYYKAAKHRVTRPKIPCHRVRCYTAISCRCLALLLRCHLPVVDLLLLLCCALFAYRVGCSMPLLVRGRPEHIIETEKYSNDGAALLPTHNANVCLYLIDNLKISIHQQTTSIASLGRQARPCFRLNWFVTSAGFSTDAFSSHI